jgi:hypothetical protein
MKKIIILLMAVSIMLTSCGKSAGLSNSDKKAGNKTPLAGSDKKNLPQNTKGFWHTATNFLWDHKFGVGITAGSLIVFGLVCYYYGKDFARWILRNEEPYKTKTNNQPTEEKKDDKELSEEAKQYKEQLRLMEVALSDKGIEFDNINEQFKAFKSRSEQYYNSLVILNEKNEKAKDDAERAANTYLDTIKQMEETEQDYLNEISDYEQTINSQNAKIVYFEQTSNARKQTVEEFKLTTERGRQIIEKYEKEIRWQADRILALERELAPAKRHHKKSRTSSKKLPETSPENSEALPSKESVI